MEQDSPFSFLPDSPFLGLKVTFVEPAHWVFWTVLPPLVQRWVCLQTDPSGISW